MALVPCRACQRHHDPATACPFCAGGEAEPIATKLGGALLISAATTLGCVGQPAPPVPGRPALIDSLPTPAPGPTPTPEAATTYGMPPPRRRKD